MKAFRDGDPKALVASAYDECGARYSEARARRHVPEADFRCGDIMDMAFEPRSFDAVVSFYALFHLPREGHPGYTEPDFFGVAMYWSHHAAPWYTATVRALGFDVLAEGVLGHGYRGVSGLPPERHPVVFARLPEAGA